MAKVRTTSVVLATSILVACSSGGGSGGTAPPGGRSGSTSSGSYTIDYTASRASLIPFSLRLDLARTPIAGRAAPSIPAITGKLGQGRTIVDGSNQQRTTFTLSSSETALEGVDAVTFEFSLSRAFGETKGEKLDAGETVEVDCNLYWNPPEDSDLLGGTGTTCDVKRSGDGYEATIKQLRVVGGSKDTSPAVDVSGTLRFAPVPSAPFAATVAGGCPGETTCLSLDPSQIEPQTGYCLPTVNLKAKAEACGTDCSSPLRIKTGGEETCVCAKVCGRVETGGGGSPPVCDPAYGCIDY